MIRTMRGFRAGCSLFGSSWLAGQGRMVLSQGLFRQEVIDARRGEWLGSIIVAAPLSRWLLTALASVLATTILLFLFLGHYTRRETVTGQLVPNAGLLNVVAPDAGTVTQLHVRDGQRVKAGDTLCVIEAMKMLNQIESDKDGVVSAILVENGQPVEYGQPLFAIE